MISSSIQRDRLQFIYRDPTTLTIAIMIAHRQWYLQASREIESNLYIGIPDPTTLNNCRNDLSPTMISSSIQRDRLQFIYRDPTTLTIAITISHRQWYLQASREIESNLYIGIPDPTTLNNCHNDRSPTMISSSIQRDWIQFIYRDPTTLNNCHKDLSPTMISSSIQRDWIQFIYRDPTTLTIAVMIVHRQWYLQASREIESNLYIGIPLF